MIDLPQLNKRFGRNWRQRIFKLCLMMHRDGCTTIVPKPIAEWMVQHRFATIIEGEYLLDSECNVQLTAAGIAEAESNEITRD